MTLVNKKNIICITIILLVSIFFRFYDLNRRGLLEWDEGYYVELVKTYRAGFDYLFKTKILKHNLGNLSDYILENGGTFESVFKDGFTYLATLTSFIFGMNENTILFANALFGTLTVLLLYLFLKSRISQANAFFIALAFSVSPFHIAYSRGGNSTIAAAFFLLISVYFYLRYLEENGCSLLFYSGLFLSLSFSCHYIVILFVFIIFIYEIYLLLTKRGRINKILHLFFAFFIPLFILDLISRLIRFFVNLRLPQLTAIYNITPYFSKFLNQMYSADGGEKYKNINHFYYLNNFIYHEGFLVIILLFLIALVLLYQRKNRLSNIFLVFVIFLPLIILSIKYSSASRVVVVILPLFYLIIGYGLFYLNRLRYILLSIIVVITCFNAYKSLDYFNYRSNFDKVVNFMQEHEGIKHISDDMYLSRAYVGRKNAVDDFISVTEKATGYPVSLRKIKDLYASGYRYLILYDPPYYLNELTRTALKMKPNFSVESIGNNRGILSNTDLGLLRFKFGKPFRYIYVYSLDKLIRELEPSQLKISK